MQNDGFAEKPETRKEVCRDHFVAAPVYQMIVQEIMEQMRAITDAIAAVRAEYENMVYKIREVGQDMADYCDAVFTGVIALEGRMVIYHQNRFDREDITLSKRGEGFEFGSVPVYQGFVSYQKLPGETREEIRKKQMSGIMQMIPRCRIQEPDFWKNLQMTGSGHGCRPRVPLNSVKILWNFLET